MKPMRTPCLFQLGDYVTPRHPQTSIYLGKILRADSNSNGYRFYSISACPTMKAKTSYWSADESSLKFAPSNRMARIAELIDDESEKVEILRQAVRNRLLGVE